MNIVQVQQALKSVPDQALINYVQHPTPDVPQYLALAELQSRKATRGAAQGQQAAAQGQQPTIAQKETAAQAPQGIAQVPAPNMEQAKFAGGGIVSFAKGGDVPAYDPNDYIAPVDGPATKAYRAKIAQEKAYAMAHPPSVLEQSRNGLSISPLNPSHDNWDIGAQFKPQTEAEFFKGAQYLPQAPSTAPTNTSMMSTDPNNTANPINPSSPLDISYAQYLPQHTDIPSSTAQPDTKTDKTGASTKTTVGVRGLQNNLVDPEKLKFDKIGNPDYSKLIPEEVTADDERNRMKGYLGEDTGLAAIKDRMTKMDTDAAEAKRVAPWEALTKFGTEMAANASKPGATFLGAASQASGEGIKSLKEAKVAADAADEKHFALQAQLAQQERAAKMAEFKFGEDSVQANDAQRRAGLLAQKADESATNRFNATGGFEANKANLDAQLKSQDMQLSHQDRQAQIHATTAATNKEEQMINAYADQFQKENPTMSRTDALDHAYKLKGTVALSGADTKADTAHRAQLNANLIAAQKNAMLNPQGVKDAQAAIDAYDAGNGGIASLPPAIDLSGFSIKKK